MLMGMAAAIGSEGYGRDLFPSSPRVAGIPCNEHKRVKEHHTQRGNVKPPRRGSPQRLEGIHLVRAGVERSTRGAVFNYTENVKLNRQPENLCLKK